MAWRIGANVVRGEIDNRMPGIIRGFLYLEGQTQQVTLELEGDCHPDLAGRHLTFRNLMPSPMANPDGFVPLQSGEVGTMTANRMARIPTIPEAEVNRCIQEGVAFPTRWSESLYLEWFSDNGRVLIEGASFICQLSPPKWRLSEERHQWLQYLKERACPQFELDDPDDADPEDLSKPLVFREEETGPYGWRIPTVEGRRLHPTLQRVSQFLLQIIFECRARKFFDDDAIANQPLEGMIEAANQGNVRLARALAKAGDGLGARRATEVVSGLKQARWSLAVASENASLAEHMGSAETGWLKTLRREFADQRNEIRSLIHEYQDMAQPTAPAGSAAPADPNRGEDRRE